MANPSPNDLSFLPDDYFERKSRRRTNAICGGLAVIVLGGIGAAFFSSERATKAFEKRHATIAAEYNDAARRIEQANRMQQQQAQIVHRAELAATLLERVPRSNMLAEITNKLPAGVSLVDLAMDSKERTPTAAPPAKTAFEQKKAQAEKVPTTPAKAYDVGLKVIGVAGTDVQVAQFIKQLDASPLFKDVNLLVSESTEYQGRTMRRFQIEVAIDPTAEVKPEVIVSNVAEIEK